MEGGHPAKPKQHTSILDLLRRHGNKEEKAAASAVPRPVAREVRRAEAVSLTPFLTEPVHLERGFTILKGKASASSSQDSHSSAPSHSDLVAGQYEGGFKLWESSIDLIETLRVEVQDGHLSFRGKDVLELGCGHGLPGILACLKGASSVHFQDFNASVLTTITIPNVIANLAPPECNPAPHPTTLTGIPPTTLTGIPPTTLTGIPPTKRVASTSLTTNKAAPSNQGSKGQEQQEQQQEQQQQQQQQQTVYPRTPRMPHPQLVTRFYAGDWADMGGLLSVVGSKLPKKREQATGDRTGPLSPEACVAPEGVREGESVSNSVDTADERKGSRGSGAGMPGVASGGSGGSGPGAIGTPSVDSEGSEGGSGGGRSSAGAVGILGGDSGGSEGGSGGGHSSAGAVGILGVDSGGSGGSGVGAVGTPGLEIGGSGGGVAGSDVAHGGTDGGAMGKRGERESADLLSSQPGIKGALGRGQKGKHVRMMLEPLEIEMGNAEDVSPPVVQREGPENTRKLGRESADTGNGTERAPDAESDVGSHLDCSGTKGSETKPPSNGTGTSPMDRSHPHKTSLERDKHPTDKTQSKKASLDRDWHPGSPLAYHKVLEGSPAFCPKSGEVQGPHSPHGLGHSLPRDACEGGDGGYDVILTAETVYSIASLTSLLDLVKKCLRKPYGVLYLAGKKYYFGVGGGTRKFMDLLKDDGVLRGHLLKEIVDGSSNVREVWKVYYKP